MGYWYDIYVASPVRNRSSIDKFLKRYVDLERENSRNDFVISLIDTDFWLKTRTLEDSVQLGLLNGDCRYTLYLDSLNPELKSSLVHYTSSGHLIFGVSIEADRKSTRLNSSHVKISYAVFCLKKKNDTI